MAASQPSTAPARSSVPVMEPKVMESSATGTGKEQLKAYVNTLAYSHLGELQFEPVVPDGFRAAVNASGG